MNVDIIDRGALRRLLDLIGGDPEDLDELLADYRDAAPDLAARISSAAGAGDVESLRVAAHTLKSNARDFGATRLSSLCETLERQCRDGALPDPRGLADEIVSAEAAARQALGNVTAKDLSD